MDRSLAAGASAPPPTPETADDADAGTELAPDSGAVVPDSGAVAPPPRTDGCPDAAPRPVDRARVYPAQGQAAQLVGARIQGSLSGPTTDFVDLATISQVPAEGTFTELTWASPQLYRYLRYYAPPGSQGGLAEVEFYSGQTRLQGEPFGTAIGDADHPFAAAQDGDPSTYFVAAANGGGYVGLDIARGYVTEPVTFTPADTTSTEPVDVELSSATPDATIRYTTDGSSPTAESGQTYDEPIHLEDRTSLHAIATSACRFDSPIESATYTITSDSGPIERGLKSYHIGNSLTDTINPWLEPIADSTGVDHVYARWTIPGAPIKWLADHEGEGFEDPEGASQFDSFVQSFAPIDHLSIQPYSDPNFESQGGAAIQLLSRALEYSPDIQFWIYAQWPGQTEWATDAFSVGGGSVNPDWQVPKQPTNWEEGVENEVVYHERFRDYVDARVGGRPFRIVPGGLALVELKREIDAGSVPGFTDFFGSMFEDEAHLTKPAQYLISLVFYSCLYEQSPVGRVTFANTGLSADQAEIFQRIAWDVASSYPGSGIGN